MSRLRGLLSAQRTRRALDVALAAAVAVGGLADALIAPGHGTGWYGPLPLRVVAALLSGVPLAWRVNRPIPAYLAVWIGSGLAAIAAGSHQGPFEVFVGLVVGAYSVGAHVRSTRIGVALAVVPTLVAAPIALAVQGSSAGNEVPFVVWIVGFWLVGRVIHGWRSRAVELEGANRELAEQRELRARAAVAVERGRIARELHDVIAHNVSMIVVQAAAAARVLEGNQPHVRDALVAIESTGRETVDEMRRLLGVLRRADDGLALAPQPGLRDLDALVANVREAGLAVELRVEGEPLALPPGIDLSAYRIVQEALTNALKHAGQARAEVRVRYATGAVELEIRDDGEGSGNGGGTGHGLVGMRERVALWGGSLDAGRREGGGWAVRALLPVEGVPG